MSDKKCGPAQVWFILGSNFQILDGRNSSTQVQRLCGNAEAHSIFCFRVESTNQFRNSIILRKCWRKWM